MADTYCGLAVGYAAAFKTLLDIGTAFGGIHLLEPAVVWPNGTLRNPRTFVKFASIWPWKYPVDALTRVGEEVGAAVEKASSATRARSGRSRTMARTNCYGGQMYVPTSR